MLMGPVFRAELIRFARRRRYYVLRVACGLLLLLFFWQGYEALWHRLLLVGNGLSISLMAGFASETFLRFASLQLAALLVLVPPMVGGAIADETQRKTLHYLMASRLSSAEIVLDKLAARLLTLGVFVAMGIPVVFLLMLFGGLPAELILGAYACTLSTTFLVASLAILISSQARKVRQAVLITYLLELAWLVGLPAADLFTRFVFPATYGRLGPAFDLANMTNPFMPLGSLVGSARGFGRPGLPMDTAVWMVGSQVAAGLLLLLLTIARLRPSFRNREARPARLSWFVAGRRRLNWTWLRRPPCGNDAMRWKEMQFSRTDIFTKLVVLPATVIVTLFLILSTNIDETVRWAVSDFLHHGYRLLHDQRAVFNRDLRAFSVWYIGLWLLSVAGASASAVSTEREEDTWTSLIATPLTGREIVVGKVLGAVWGLRGYAALLGMLWLIGLVIGAVHPLGLLAGLVAVGLLTWFVAVLGTYHSLRAKTTSRALTATLVVLIVLNAGYLVVGWPFLEGNPLVWIGCTPYLAANALAASYQLIDLGEILKQPNPWVHIEFRALAYGAAVLALYALATVYLTHRAIGRFDDWLDRPRASNPTRPQSVRQPTPEPVAEAVR